MLNDPLIDPPREIKLPGVKYHNPVNDVARIMLILLAWSALVIWLFNWAWSNPMPDCVYDGEVEVCLDPTIP